jgi:hypothetical protein
VRLLVIIATVAKATTPTWSSRGAAFLISANKPNVIASTPKIESSAIPKYSPTVKLKNKGIK